ncbi:MAG: DUF1800 domain-containing protein [Planctomycetota bacterium]|nr:DUF1800 domain-containing protein [Planctomycetota bacterium]
MTPQATEPLSTSWGVVTTAPTAAIFAAPPSDPFSEYQPSDVEPWDSRRVNHLLRRAALGPGHDLGQALIKMSPGAAVNFLLDFDAARDPFNDLLDRMEGFFNFRSIEDVQGWCFFRMLDTPRMTQERMALYWHNHFATSASKVEQPRLMHGQIEMFRQKGLGSFRDLVVAIAHDPAMLIWLDGQSSKKGHANENFAREVMELFTLGIGNYTEKDVRELARAFTGWRIANEKGVFDPKQWDSGEKTAFGVTGVFNAEAAVDLILAQPAASKFLTKKLLQEFVHPQPMQEHIDHYANRLIENKWEIRPFLKEIFTSRMFYSDWAYRSRIKSPVELAIGTVIALGGKPNTDFITKVTARMGQNLLFPPNVKGWDGNEAWINANTVLVRFNFGLSVATQQQALFAEKPDIEGMLKSRKITTAQQVVDYFAMMLLDGNVEPAERAKFVDFLLNPPSHHTNSFVLNHDTFTHRVADLLHLMMSTPEYQLA